MTTKLKFNWQKCPSVTTGGKAYFYVLFLPCNINEGTRNKWSVVWDRTGRTWLIKCENMTTGHSTTWGVGKAHLKAMQNAETIIGLPEDTESVGQVNHAAIW